MKTERFIVEETRGCRRGRCTTVEWKKGGAGEMERGGAGGWGEGVASSVHGSIMFPDKCR